MVDWYLDLKDFERESFVVLGDFCCADFVGDVQDLLKYVKPSKRNAWNMEKWTHI